MKRITILALCGVIGMFFHSIGFCGENGFASGCAPSSQFRGLSCADFKETLSNDNLYVTFRDMPLFSKKSTCWTLQWNGIRVFLPPSDFEQVHVKKRTDGTYDLFLKTKEGVWVSATSDENTVFTDIFAVTTGGQTLETSTDGVALTNRIYGGPISLFELMMRAYEKTPDQITCGPESCDGDISVAIAMILKKMARRELEAAYKVGGARPGWMTESNGKPFREYELNLLGPDRDRIVHLSYRMPEDAPFHDLPFRVAGAESVPGIDAPSWLEALNRALASPFDGEWRRYAVAARQCGISEKSISASLENLKIHVTP